MTNNKFSVKTALVFKSVYYFYGGLLHVGSKDIIEDSFEKQKLVGHFIFLKTHITLKRFIYSRDTESLNSYKKLRDAGVT